jgi:hypothetical protein
MNPNDYLEVYCETSTGDDITVMTGSTVVITAVARNG